MLHSFCQRKANNGVNVRERPPAHAEVSGCRPGAASVQGGRPQLGEPAQPDVLGRGWGAARGPAAPTSDGSGTEFHPHAVSVGCSSADPNIPKGVSGWWSGSPPGSARVRF